MMRHLIVPIVLLAVALLPTAVVADPADRPRPELPLTSRHFLS